MPSDGLVQNIKQNKLELPKTLIKFLESCILLDGGHGVAISLERSIAYYGEKTVLKSSNPQRCILIRTFPAPR